MTRHHLLLAAALLAAWAAFCPSAHTNAPDWWVERGVTTADPADDYAVANIGQLKHIATAAADELNSYLPGGAGAVVNDLVLSWEISPDPGTSRDDYAAINLGQLKAVAEPFYQRLVQAEHSTGYPWDGGTPDDYALANIGQVKNVFSFDVTLDSNENGLPDWWEIHHLGHLFVPDPQNPEEHDRLLEAYALGLNPNVAAIPEAPGGGGSVRLIVYTDAH